MPLTVEPERRFEPVMSNEHLPIRLDGRSSNGEVARSMCTLDPISKALLEICRVVKWFNYVCVVDSSSCWSSKGLLWEQKRDRIAIRARGNVKITISVTQIKQGTSEYDT